MAEEPRLVLLSSPYSGAVDRNVLYAHECLADSLARGEAPLASHVLYTQALDDDVPAQREQGMRAGHAWGRWAAATVVYTDLGLSLGMVADIREANAAGRPVEFRSLD